MGRRDLTEGAVFPTLCCFALPMILGNLLQQCYNIVDTWVVGRCVGSAALGAVGSAFALMTFLTSILLGLCMGSGVVFSLCFGTRDEERLEDGVRTSLLLPAAPPLAPRCPPPARSWGWTPSSSGRTSPPRSRE